MIAAAIVCAAVVSQAAVAVTWKTGTGVKDVAGNAFVNGKQEDYTCSILFSTESDMSKTFEAGGTLSSSQYMTKGSAGFGNVKTDAKFDAGTYYAQLTIEYKDGRKYTSDIGKFTIAEGVSVGPTINFTTGDNMGGKSLIGKMEYSGVPEPTSGLLVLLGVAGLALRRRRA